MKSSRNVRMAATVAAAIWIFGGALLFFCRFTVAFYEANGPAVQNALSRLSQIFK